MHEIGEKSLWLAGVHLLVVTDNAQEHDQVMLGIYDGLCREDFPKDWVQIHERDNDLLTLFGVGALSYNEAALTALAQIENVRKYYDQIKMVGALILARIKPPLDELLEYAAKQSYPQCVTEATGLGNVVPIERAFAVRAQ